MEHIRARRTGPREDDLLQVLLDGDLGEGGRPLTDDEVLTEGMQVLVAGHETSSTALGWALYLLSRNPDYAEQSRRELQRAAEAGPLGAADLERLPLTVNLIEEALRLYPPFWMIDRLALADDLAGDVPIPKGTTVIAFVHGVQNGGEYWDSPHDFAPERFTGAVASAVSGFHHLPFGAGPRRCIGANYAMLQMATILQALQCGYKFRLADSPKVAPHTLVTQCARDGVWMHFERRVEGERAKGN
jgi:cytochrome P450